MLQTVPGQAQAEHMAFTLLLLLVVEMVWAIAAAAAAIICHSGVGALLASHSLHG
jgi:hypothetical protein